ncbi:LytTR family DNA-binding domain-containing protein [uncultured Bacteroides sp.]|uniref:LytR/AlgR family response regulator transcription factor n=1 Tax=uncultured Bacteroides sp. TaxID=162156 RepID=UPI00262524CE|nr:LytTR family DNA-binding domain-containing protein [uncultured Bacteroides sp.]
MKTLTCYIVDDEPLAVKMLENFAERTPGIECKASFTDSYKALEALDREHVDIIFLDIQMPGLDGLELSRLVPTETAIIFTTAFKEYAYDSYEVEAIDFLLKPIRYQKFQNAVEKVRKRIEPSTSKEESNSLFIRTDNMLRKIDFNQILYECGLKDYIKIYLKDEKRPLITHLTMKSMEEMLPANRFMRVHRSYIIALDQIRAVDRNNCIYIGDEIIHVTDAYKDNFTAYLEANMPK